jgi:hypothetical protein
VRDDGVSPFEVRVLRRIDVDGVAAVEFDSDVIGRDGKHGAGVAVQHAQLGLGVLREDNAIVGRELALAVLELVQDAFADVSETLADRAVNVLDLDSLAAGRADLDDMSVIVELPKATLRGDTIRFEDGFVERRHDRAHPLDVRTDVLPENFGELAVVAVLLGRFAQNAMRVPGQDVLQLRAATEIHDGSLRARVDPIEALSRPRARSSNTRQRSRRYWTLSAPSHDLTRQNRQ